MPIKSGAAVATRHHEVCDVGDVPGLPLDDNTSEALSRLRELNLQFRDRPWPAPFNETEHKLRLGDARTLDWIPNDSVHLIVTSPPYWNLKEYEQGQEHQLGDIDDYEKFLSELDKVWTECERVLVPGGRVCCVVGDVCIPRKTGRHHVMPLHADIQVRARNVGLDCLTPILWHKIANGSTEAEGNGAGFYGKPYQPGAIVKNDTEYILFLRKGGTYRKVNAVQRMLSMLTKDEMQGWLRSIWTDIRGASTKDGHPAPYPIGIADRLIRLFSFAGDTVLDPFASTGSTAVAALRAGRNSVSNEIESVYFETAYKRLSAEILVARERGAISSKLCRINS